MGRTRSRRAPGLAATAIRHAVRRPRRRRRVLPDHVGRRRTRAGQPRRVGPVAAHGIRAADRRARGHHRALRPGPARRGCGGTAGRPGRGGRRGRPAAGRTSQGARRDRGPAAIRIPRRPVRKLGRGQYREAWHPAGVRGLSRPRTAAALAPDTSAPAGERAGKVLPGNPGGEGRRPRNAGAGRSSVGLQEGLFIPLSPRGADHPHRARLLRWLRQGAARGTGAAGSGAEVLRRSGQGAGEVGSLRPDHARERDLALPRRPGRGGNGRGPALLGVHPSGTSSVWSITTSASAARHSDCGA